MPDKPHEPKPDAAQHRVADLLRNPRLLPVFLFSGLLATGWDLYTFVIPIYGSRIGLSASTIGIIMSSFALATFVVRLAMPSVARRLSEWTVVGAALLIAGIAYSLFPLVTQVPLLIALSFLLGLGLGCAQPMIMAALYAASPLAAGAPGRGGRHAHHHDQREPDLHAARLRRGRHRARHAADPLDHGRRAADRQLARAQTPIEARR